MKQTLQYTVYSKLFGQPKLEANYTAGAVKRQTVHTLLGNDRQRFGRSVEVAACCHVRVTQGHVIARSVYWASSLATQTAIHSTSVHTCTSDLGK